MTKKRSIFFLALFSISIHFGSNSLCFAQELRAVNFNLVHWAYAPAFGTGIYQIGENREIYVLKFSPRLTHRFKFEKVFKDRELLLEFNFPLTFGVHTFDFKDLIGGGFPDQIRQISITPGLEIKLPLSSRWDVRIFGNLGWGSATESGGESAWIYWGGIKSRIAFPIRKMGLAMINGYSSYGYTPNHGSPGDLSGLMNGLELDIPIGNIGGSEEPFFLKTHVMNLWYFDHVDFLVGPRKDLVSLGSEWEIGAAIGKSQKTKIWLFSIDRIGLGYRFSAHTKGIRIYFSSYFR